MSVLCGTLHNSAVVPFLSFIDLNIKMLDLWRLHRFDYMSFLKIVRIYCIMLILPKQTVQKPKIFSSQSYYTETSRKLEQTNNNNNSLLN